MHMHELVAELIDAGLDLDLMPPDDDYKLEWGARAHTARNHVVPITLIGRLISQVHNPVLRETRQEHLSQIAPWLARNHCGAGA